jgi:DNA-binding protein H-NS
LERLDQILAKQAKEKSEADAKLAQAVAYREQYSKQLIADPAAHVRLTNYGGSGRSRLNNYEYGPTSVLGDTIETLLTPAAVEVWRTQYAKLEAEQEQARQRKQQQEAKAEADRKAFAAAKDAAKKVAYDEAVANYGSDVQQEMHKRGMLNEDTITKWLRNEAFKGVNLPIYQRLTEDDCTFPDGTDRDQFKLYWRDEKVELPTPEQFAAALQVEQLLPDCTWEITKHLIEDDDYSVEFTPAKYSLDVEVERPWGTLKRSFAL